MSPSKFLLREVSQEHTLQPHTCMADLLAPTRMSNSISSITYQVDNQDGKERSWERSNWGFSSIFLPFIATVGGGVLHFQSFCSLPRFI